MTARYLVRLDDACPTMHQARWGAVEQMLDELNVRPLVAVVPDNRDPSLVLGPPDQGFWSRVRGWQAKGWTIAMHGLHHLYHPVNRRRLLLPFYERSEVAGLDLAQQAALIARSWALFTAQGVYPTAWIAPSHSFDRTTLAALAQETPIRIISDGLSIAPFEQDGFHWVPQQLWAPAPRERGVWTICLHPNSMGEEDVKRLRQTLVQPFYRERLACIADLPVSPGGRSLEDKMYRFYFMTRHRLFPVLLPFYQILRQRMRTTTP